MRRRQPPADVRPKSWPVRRVQFVGRIIARVSQRSVVFVFHSDFARRFVAIRCHRNNNSQLTGGGGGGDITSCLNGSVLIVLRPDARGDDEHDSHAGEERGHAPLVDDLQRRSLCCECFVLYVFSLNALPVLLKDHYRPIDETFTAT